MSRWFRWYEGTCEDGKFRVIARNAGVTVRDAIALWTFILEDAANVKHRGICTRNEDFMSAVLDFEDGEVEKILSGMDDAGLVSVGHGAISVCNWGKRQFDGSPSDPTNVDRQKKFREKRKRNDAVTVRNGNVTGNITPDTERTDTERKKEDVCVAGALAKMRPEAFSIADECYRILGINLEMIPLEWCGLTYQIDIMLMRGYDAPGILATAAKLSGHKPLKPMNYFIKAVESAQQNQIKPAEKQNGKSGNIVDAADALIERIADFDRPSRGAVRSGEGAAVVRLLPEG